jgi:hypothetical protein
MDISSTLAEFARTKVEEPIKSLNIEESESSIWDTSDMESPFVMTIRYEDDDRIGLGRDIVPLTDDELGRKMSQLFDRLNSNIVSNRPDINIESPSVSFEVDSTYFYSENPEDVPEPEPKIDSEIVAMRRVNRVRGRVSKEFNELTDMVVEEAVDSFGDDITRSDFTELEFYFCDFRICELTSVHAYVATENPHLYYKDVSSADEFVERAPNPNELEDGVYEVFFRLGYGEDGIDSSNIPDEIVSRAGSIMSTRLNNYVQVQGQHTYEAENISIEDGVERTSFYIRQDATDTVEDIEGV